MKTRIKYLILFNILTIVLFLLPAGQLDLFTENYSTLSLKTEGYLYLLMLGILTGAVMAYETSLIAGRKAGLIVFAAMFLGTMIPHHVPYDFQGDLHLLLAYTGFFVLILSTYRNTFLAGKDLYGRVLMLVLCAAVLLYMRYMMVNTLAEIIIMLTCLGIDLMISLEILKKRP